MVSFEINGHRWSKVPDAASCWTLTTAVAACIWVMRALMSVKHSVLDLTSFKRCLFNLPSCSYCFRIDDPTKTVFVSEISGAGVSCRAGLTAWKRRRRSIHVGLLEKVGWAEGQWEWERERERERRMFDRGCNRDPFLPVQERIRILWMADGIGGMAGGAAVQKRVGDSSCAALT